jgi:hypothetical protein
MLPQREKNSRETMHLLQSGVSDGNECTTRWMTSSSHLRVNACSDEKDVSDMGESIRKVTYPAIGMSQNCGFGIIA